MSKADAHSTLSHFYVYALFRESGVPLYIGKGCGDRWLHHEKRARNGVGGYKHEIIRGMQARGLEVIKVKLHEGLTEAVAHAYEVALIRAIGRGQAGPLVNLTDGGDGVSGFKHPPGKKRSPEHVAKVAAARRGKKFSPRLPRTPPRRSPTACDVSHYRLRRRSSATHCGPLGLASLMIENEWIGLVNRVITLFGRSPFSSRMRV
jgi:hypothetical protein